MSLTGIYANLACTDLARSERWFAVLFGRVADAHPMDGLAEWHMDGHGFQLHQNPDKAGKGTLTLMASGLAAERERLSGLAPGEIEAGDAISILHLSDPDANLVVLAGSQ